SASLRSFCASVGYIWRMRRRVLIDLSLETSGHFATQAAKTRGENFCELVVKIANSARFVE
ncbi:hypothetical protein, partial [Serratia marcescens]